MIDTGRHAWHREAILDFAKAHHKPIAAIINSHWHLDHVSGNPDLRAAYPMLRVYASNAIDDALRGFLARSAADAQKYLEPNAATAGDVWVFDPKTKVLASGDLVTLPAAFLDTACPAGWSNALGEIDATPFRILLPGHGAPMNRAQFQTYRSAFDALVACAATDRDANDCAAEWTKNIQPLPGADPANQKQAQAMTIYYVKDVLRPHGGKSAECNA